MLWRPRFVACLFGALAWPVSAAAVPSVRPEVLGSVPHDVAAFTQGLLLHEGTLYESTGLQGRSSVRRVNPSTGEVLQSVRLPAEEFGEGLARVEDRLVQLTWKNGVAHVYDLALTELTHFNYDGEGWGLCFDGQRLIMSDGSSSLFFRDPSTFELLGSVEVKADGVPVEELNELECVGSLVYANVWQTDAIVRIDPSTGEVLTRIDASGLLTAAEDRTADVLNGIAYDATTGHFWITGKLWPHVFEVRFDFDPDSRDAAPGGSASDAPTAQPSPAPASSPMSAPSQQTPPTPAANRSHEDSGCACSSAPTPLGKSGLGLLFVTALFCWRRRRAAPAVAFAVVACSSAQRITQTGSNTYRIDCSTALSRCLEQAEYVCPHGFELRDAVEERERRGVDVVGTGPDIERHSEAIVVCRSSEPLLDLRSKKPPAPRPSAERVCTPGGTQQCIGGGGCRGGQACLPSGTGYGPCDCVLGVPVPSEPAPTEPPPAVSTEPPPAVSAEPPPETSSTAAQRNPHAPVPSASPSAGPTTGP